MTIATDSFVNQPKIIITDEETKALARTVINLFQRWQINDEQARALLGGLQPNQWRAWHEGEYGTVSEDTRLRMADLIGIHKQLRLCFSDPERGYAWVQKTNIAFDGRRPLDVMLGGTEDGIFRVRAYLASHDDSCMHVTF